MMHVHSTYNVTTTPKRQGTLFYMEVDVGITLRVTSIVLPPAAQSGAHEDHPPTKVGRYVGSREGFLKDKERRRRNKKSLVTTLFIT
jgi:hypothetical protein